MYQKYALSRADVNDWPYIQQCIETVNKENNKEFYELREEELYKEGFTQVAKITNKVVGCAMFKYSHCCKDMIRKAFECETVNPQEVILIDKAYVLQQESGSRVLTRLIKSAELELTEAIKYLIAYVPRTNIKCVHSLIRSGFNVLTIDYSNPEIYSIMVKKL